MRFLAENQLTPFALNGFYEALGSLLSKPWGGEASLGSLREELTGVCPEASASLAQFEASAKGIPLGLMEEAYTRAFDVAPQCVPYVSVHLFGEENYKRGELMAALLSAFARVGFDHGFELADHVSVLLRFIPWTKGEERRELLGLCLKGPLVPMTAALMKAQNPYGHLLQTARDLVGMELNLEESHA